MDRRDKLIFSNPASPPAEDDWVKIKYQFTMNYPANLAEEAEIAAKLAGITSRKTQLKVLSLVDNIDEELETIEEEMDTEGYNTDFPTNRTDE